MKVEISPGEVEPLRTMMCDLQLSVARYYAGTGSGQTIGSLVRGFITHCQTLNDWLMNSIEDKESYAQLFRSPRHPQADVIEAVKYVRNVAQHVLHVISPDPAVTVVGGVLGTRIYAKWDEVPEDVHAKLRTNTQKLKPLYDSNLRSREVVETMMEVLRFFADVVPEIVHRDESGEWTGFPLLSQPGMSAPLHPEEPLCASKAREWLDSRRPGGRYRVICAQVAVEEALYYFGYTFSGRYSFAPFSETLEQVLLDMKLGYSYYWGDFTGKFVDVSEKFQEALQGGVVEVLEEVSSWATPLDERRLRQDWQIVADPELVGFVRLENVDIVPERVRYEVRRARRLYALTPPRIALGGFA